MGMRNDWMAVIVGTEAKENSTIVTLFDIPYDAPRYSSLRSLDQFAFISCTCLNLTC